MACHLGALVPGDGSTQCRGQITETSTERVVECVAVALGQMQQPDEAGLALNEGADGGLLILADDQIVFSVARLGAVAGWEGPLVDRQHRLFEACPAAIGTLLCPAMVRPVRSGERCWGASGDGRISGDPGW
jgi:hypothetical protein